MHKNRMQRAFAEQKSAAQPVRLNKYISEAGICSRREADRLIAVGKVLVDGRPAVTGQKILPTQEILVDGRTAVREREMILLAVNKPRGVVCTTDRRWGDVTITDFLKYPKRIFPVGRLDKDSEGLLLMTNNGELLNQIMRAANFHEKEYVVEVDRPLTEEFLRKMEEGVWLEALKVRTRPCRIRRRGERSFSIVLTQGLNRQIRRMCRALGYHVTRLQRIRIMNIRLGDLPKGQYRDVTDAELEILYDSVKNSRS